MDSSQLLAQRRIGFVGTYPPRRCGIATFTADLRGAVAEVRPDDDAFSIAVSDRRRAYQYPPEVQFEILNGDLDSYRRAADFLNISEVDAVSLQHEFGIFGGASGQHVLALLRELRMPVVTTLHTVLQTPTDEQRRVIGQIDRLSDRLVVMSEKAVSFLEEVSGISPSRVDLIPHGTPDVPFDDPNEYKKRFAVDGKTVLLTFGLLGPNKGIEYVIRALPEIVSRHPDTVYVVLGATHPNVRREFGEQYRLSLHRLADQLDVADHVIFHDRYVQLDRLIEFICAADIYITPYLVEAQITSGTLAYSIAAGKAVVSTPYWHAQELLADDRGRLVPFADADAIGDAVCGLLDDDDALQQTRRRAYEYGRHMIWSEVAEAHLASFEHAMRDREARPPRVLQGQAIQKRRFELPRLKLTHLRRLTDQIGLLHHADHAVPKYEHGYSTDDNARALMLMAWLDSLGQQWSDRAADLLPVYFGFVRYAFNEESGRFRNFMSFDRRWLEESGSEDCHGRAVWALGAVTRWAVSEDLRDVAIRYVTRAMPAMSSFSSPRAMAFGILGLVMYARAFSGDSRALTEVESLAERLMDLLATTRDDDWIWFEDILAYDNARLSHALLAAGDLLEREDWRTAGLESLDWLVAIQRDDARGHFVPVGSNGFYRRGGERARYDQQPVEAHATVSACLEANRITGEDTWHREAQTAFDWFLGRNDTAESLYIPKTGACRDGLHPTGVNRNQGSESTLAFLLSLAEFRMSQMTAESGLLDPSPTLEPEAVHS